MDFVGAIKAGFKNYANFRGTATLPEYWYWVLFSVLVSLVTNALDRTGLIAFAFSLATLLPGLAVTVRRLRDADFSWVWVLLPVPGLIAFVYGLSTLIQELMLLGIDESIFRNPELLDETLLTELMMNEAIGVSLLTIGLSLLFMLLTFLLVNIIFPAQQSKSFEQGNKRVAPKGPEKPSL